MGMEGEASVESVNHMEHQPDLLGEENQRNIKELFCVFQEYKGKAATETEAPRIQRSCSYERLNFDVVRKKIRSEQCYYIPSNRDSAKRAMQKFFPQSVGKKIHKMMMEGKKKKKKRKMQMQRSTEDKGKSAMAEEEIEDLIMADNSSTEGETGRGTEMDTWSVDSEIGSISETVRWLCTELEENVRQYMNIGPPNVNSDVKLVFEHVKNLFELLRVFTLGQDLNKLEMEQQDEEMNLEQMRNSTMTFHFHELQDMCRMREMNCLDEGEDDDKNEHVNEDEEEIDENCYQSAMEKESHEEEDEEEIDETYYQSAMEKEMKAFDEHRRDWESSWAKQCGCFYDTTELSPMIFTHRTPGVRLSHAVCGTTMQIYSIKVAKVKNAPWLKWPLQVYGLVAVRDEADHNRNFIFRRRRNECEILTQEERSLRLTGPSRAIVSGSFLCFEVQLKLKGKTESEDRLLMSEVFHDYPNYDHRLHTFIWQKHFCTVEFSCRQLHDSVQATILSVCVVEGTPWPFKYGSRVACCTPPQETMLIDEDGTVMDITDPPSKQVVLLDSRGEEMPIGSDGYIDLSRKVVSVELRERHVLSRDLQATLKVIIQAYSPAYPNIAARGYVYITPKRCNISQAICDLGDSKVEITVAWSLLVADKDFMMISRFV